LHLSASSSYSPKLTDLGQAISPASHPHPSFDIAHLGHVEKFTDRFDKSLAFFTYVYGVTLTAQDAGSACSRAGAIIDFTPSS
jgi:hypothetical protein